MGKSLKGPIVKGLLFLGSAIVLAVPIAIFFIRAISI
jgi:hypothetical protein